MEKLDLIYHLRKLTTFRKAIAAKSYPNTNPPPDELTKLLEHATSELDQLRALKALVWELCLALEFQVKLNPYPNLMTPELIKSLKAKLEEYLQVD